MRPLPPKSSFQCHLRKKISFEAFRASEVLSNNLGSLCLCIRPLVDLDLGALQGPEALLRSMALNVGTQASLLTKYKNAPH
jgi:hypothetical protein